MSTESTVRAKAAPRDYDEDLRLEPHPDENMTKKKLHKRVHRFVKECLFGADAPPRKAQKTK